MIKTDVKERRQMRNSEAFFSLKGLLFKGKGRRCQDDDDDVRGKESSLSLFLSHSRVVIEFAFSESVSFSSSYEEIYCFIIH